jgi:hypothetical protein
MSDFKKIQSNNNAASFLNFIIGSYEDLGRGYVPERLDNEYKANHKHILEALNHLSNYLEKEEKNLKDKPYEFHIDYLIELYVKNQNTKSQYDRMKVVCEILDTLSEYKEYEEKTFSKVYGKGEEM